MEVEKCQTPQSRHYTGRFPDTKNTLFRAQFSPGLPETGSRQLRFALKVSTARKIINIWGYFTKISDFIRICPCKIAAFYWALLSIMYNWWFEGRNGLKTPDIIVLLKQIV
jgi:hypothetical protein